MASKRSQKQVAHRWYLGGLASAGAACGTHPLDLLKVHLQTQQVSRLGLVQSLVGVVKREGILGLYNGLSASVLRQLSYSGARYGVYELLKGRQLKSGDGTLTMPMRIGMSAIGGAAGGVVGCPPDLINVRMQNDMKLPVEQRRNYRHVLDGLRRVGKEEGVAELWKGGSMVFTRSILMTIAQIAVYEQAKHMLLTKCHLHDNIPTHFLSSFVAGVVATILTQPVDVLKTRMMNSRPGEYKNVRACIAHTFRVGPLGFYKGFLPACIRLTPHTILTWILLEQLRKLFPPKPIIS